MRDPGLLRLAARPTLRSQRANRRWREWPGDVCRGGVKDGVHDYVHELAHLGAPEGLARVGSDVPEAAVEDRLEIVVLREAQVPAEQVGPLARPRIEDHAQAHPGVAVGSWRAL